MHYSCLSSIGLSSDPFVGTDDLLVGWVGTHGLTLVLQVLMDVLHMQLASGVAIKE